MGLTSLLFGAGLDSSVEEDLFAGDRVYEIDITIPQRGIANLRQYHWRRWRGTGMPRPKALATVTEGGVTYTNVSVHLKGSAGSFRSVDDRPALTLNFDKHVEDQSLRGYDKLYLNNSVQDRSYANEKICRELFNAAGIPTPRATHAWVTLNGRTLGLYVMIEGFNKPFLKRHFSDVSGNLYDGGFLQDISADLSVNSGANPEDKTDLRTLFRVSVERDLRKRFSYLPKLLDMDRFYTLMALDVMTWNWDGYTMHHNNFRLFHDMESDRFIFIPHGMDQMFERADGPIFPSFRGIVARSVMELPAARTAVFDRMNTFLGGVFDGDRINQRIQAITAAIQPVLTEKDPYNARRQRTEALNLQYQVSRRTAFLQNQLGAQQRVPQFDSRGNLKLTEWSPRAHFGRPNLSRTREGGREILQIQSAAQDQVSLGRWTSKLWLRQGRYRFSGRISASNVVLIPQDANGGVGLRATRSQAGRRLRGTVAWRPFVAEFYVRNPIEEIELGCELRAASGMARFDAGSLVLTKLP